MALRPAPSVLAALLATFLLPGPASAAGSRSGVQPAPGEMVLLRDVNARTAYRPAPPGLALLVDPTPNRELEAGTGTGELGDADFAAISTGQRFGAPGPVATVDRTVEGALAAGPGSGAASQGGMMGGDGFGGAVSGPLGAVGSATRGIGHQVTGALSQFPLGQKPGGGP